MSEYVARWLTWEDAPCQVSLLRGDVLAAAVDDDGDWAALGRPWDGKRIEERPSPGAPWGRRTVMLDAVRRAEKHLCLSGKCDRSAIAHLLPDERARGVAELVVNRVSGILSSHSASVTGPSFGEALQSIGAKPGDRIRVTVELAEVSGE